ncbi:MAG: hypothetical protein WC878_05725 [Candidatus Paceibacterota bacterium]|jgi:hypothetical protein
MAIARLTATSWVKLSLRAKDLRTEKAMGSPKMTATNSQTAKGSAIVKHSG